MTWMLNTLHNPLHLGITDNDKFEGKMLEFTILDLLHVHIRSIEHCCGLKKDLKGGAPLQIQNFQYAARRERMVIQNKMLQRHVESRFGRRGKGTNFYKLINLCFPFNSLFCYHCYVCFSQSPFFNLSLAFFLKIISILEHMVTVSF